MSSWQRCITYAVKHFPAAQNHCKGFTKGIDASVNKKPAAFSFWVKIPKGTLSIYIHSFYRKTRHNFEAHIYFWKKKN